MFEFDAHRSPKLSPLGLILASTLAARGGIQIDGGTFDAMRDLAPLLPPITRLGSWIAIRRHRRRQESDDVPAENEDLSPATRSRELAMIFCAGVGVGALVLGVGVYLGAARS